MSPSRSTISSEDSARGSTSTSPRRLLPCSTRSNRMLRTPSRRASGGVTRIYGSPAMPRTPRSSATASGGSTAPARGRQCRSGYATPAAIGGRYSALSCFGLVPAAVSGIDVEALLDRARDMRRSCSPGTPADLNCGLALGTTMGLLHAAGRDKVTILAPDRIAEFSLWAEQLIAESTGKEGKGIIPIGSEPLGDPTVYGDDRLFVALRIGDDPVFDGAVGRLRSAALAVVSFDVADLHELAAEFFRWEFATAVAGAGLHIAPFDEPNV